jgi:hypothetical protein
MLDREAFRARNSQNIEIRLFGSHDVFAAPSAIRLFVVVRKRM